MVRWFGTGMRERYSEITLSTWKLHLVSQSLFQVVPTQYKQNGKIIIYCPSHFSLCGGRSAQSYKHAHRKQTTHSHKHISQVAKHIMTASTVPCHWNLAITNSLWSIVIFIFLMYICKYSIIYFHRISFVLWSDPIYLWLLKLTGCKIQQITAQWSS